MHPYITSECYLGILPASKASKMSSLPELVGPYIVDEWPDSQVIGLGKPRFQDWLGCMLIKLRPSS